MAKNKFVIEDAFAQLDAILGEMRDPSLSLADSMELYKKGVKLLDRCGKALDKTEKEIIILQEGQYADVEGTDADKNSED